MQEKKHREVGRWAVMMVEMMEVEWQVVWVGTKEQMEEVREGSKEAFERRAGEFEEQLARPLEMEVKTKEWVWEVWVWE
jgi:hypothetical protein